MPRLTLRTLLAYLDDTLPPAEARPSGARCRERGGPRAGRADQAGDPAARADDAGPGRADDTADPNTVAEYLDNTLDAAAVTQVEETSLASDVHLAEVAAVHQILTLVLTEPVRVPPRAHRRMYALVPPPAGRPRRRPNKKLLPVSGSAPPAADRADADDADAALLLGMTRYSAAGSPRARLALVGIGLVLAVMLAGAVYMALPHAGPKSPDAAPNNPVAQVTPPPLFDVAAPPAKPKDAEPPKKPGEPDPVPPPKPVEPDPVAAVGAVGAAVAGAAAGAAPEDPDPNLADPVAPPAAGAADVGRVETAGTLVVAKLPGAPDRWTRLKAKLDDDAPLPANVPVMALPGYKAGLLVGRGQAVHVLLWGTCPSSCRTACSSRG
jgi:hypothetical protein